MTDEEAVDVLYAAASRAVAAEAQVQRVREVCANPETTWRPGEGLGLVRVESILRALDGGSDD